MPEGHTRSLSRRMPVLSGELFSSSSTRLLTEIASADRPGGVPKRRGAEVVAPFAHGPNSVALSAPRYTEPVAVLTGPEQRIINAIAWLNSIGVGEPNKTAVAYGSGGFNNPVAPSAVGA